MNTSMYQIATIMVHEKPANGKVEEEFVKDENANRKEEEEDYKAKNELGEKISQNKSIHLNLFHIITIVAASSLCLLPQLMIPRHNPIYYPEYKNETIVVHLMVCFAYTLRRMMECFAFTKERQLLTVSVGLKIFVLHSVPCLGIWSSLHYFWTSRLGYHYPVPFNGLFNFFGTMLFFECCLWFGIMFPSKLRRNEEFRRKIRKLIIYDLWWIIINLQKDFLSFAFKAISGDFQFIFAFLIQAIKSMNKKVLFKLVTNMAGNQDERVFVVCRVLLNIHYALFITIRMNGAELQTVVAIFLVDFVLQLWFTRKVIRLSQKVVANTEFEMDLKRRMDKEIINLSLMELIEGIVPVAYAIGFAMAYFGPNGHLIGNVLCDAWAYEKETDVSGLFQILALLFGVDLACVLLNGFLLSCYGNISLIRGFSKMMQDHWIIVTIGLTNAMADYFIFNDMSNGLDMTMEFDWITREGRLRFIYNATDLIIHEKELLLSNNSLS